MKLAKLAIAVAALAVAAPAAAQDQWPLKQAEYVEVVGIHIDDGHGLDYAKHLATLWRSSQDFAMSKGWITGYEILANVNARDGEPDMYLITRFTEWESPEETEARGKLYQEHMKMTIAEGEQASAGRAEYRHVGSEMLLRRLVWRD